MLYNRGDFVWAKMKGYTWWPAIVLDPSDCDKKKCRPNNYWLFWFGNHTISQLNQIKMKLFKRRFNENVQKSSSKELAKAVEEAVKILALANEMNCDDIPFLMSWAMKGFQSTWPVQFQWVKAAFPKVIQDALSKVMNISKEKDIEDDAENMVKRVREGEKFLEDICIGCCKEYAMLVQLHPLFVGQVCALCKKDVDRANGLPAGKYHNYCIVCGQGGNLVFCSNKPCCRAFCEECIQYLHSKDAYAKIVSEENWECYLCQPITMNDCLIKKRNQKRRNSEDNSVSLWRLKSITVVGSETDIEKTVKRLRIMGNCPADSAENVIKKVRNSKKFLEEICIGCCKGDAIVIEPHPLFFGKVCAACKKDVDRANRLPLGRYQNYCVICGLGGNLVYCSQRICKRAYCEECIQYLDSKKAFEKIVLDDIWACYVCEPVKKKEVLN